ncbi:MAG TPA: TIM barrel protein [Gaiellaceae bacterium]|nr:TIM barrel protein [Gaiellaceae bacterium]
MSAAQPQLGITLFSLTAEYKAGKYTFEELLARTASEGVGPGVEFVGFQMIRTYPEVTDDYATRLRRLFDEHGLVPTCLDANVDIGRRRDRHMTDEETAEYLRVQMVTAKKLGFPMIRIQFGAKPGAIRLVAPIAEEMDVRLGMEIHAPHTVDHPTVVALRELYEEIDSPYLGFIPDFGSSARAVPAGAIALQRRLGVPEETIQKILDVRAEVSRGEREAFAARRELMESLQSEGASGDALQFAWRSLTLWGLQPPELWAEIMPRVLHIHGKFFGIDENGDEPSIDYATIMRVIHEASYTGTIASEWEGANWTPHPDGFAMVRAHHAMMKRYLAAA